ncbi:putative disease resistance protein RGA3 isoform X1 [Actinidia eriantha]|uniref:putative disease resistance protein RGA3 isoform X1 n=1 Tax=Actinidia eriantha TaxID=165200 RepID=UPI00258612E7|nr:putative disease resistance protein RGA3 isoform X1 [Actinidia eriantha]
MVDPIALVLGPLVEIVLGKAISFATQKYQLLQGVQEDVKKLISHLTAIQSVIEDAEKRQLVDTQTRDWLGKLQEAVFDAEDVLETFATEALLRQKKQQVQKFNIPLGATEIDSKLKCAYEIKDILKRLDIIIEEKNKFQLKISDVREINETRHTSSLVVESDVFGREEDKNIIVHRLLSEEYDREGEVSCLPIIGMGGLGKTTLAQVVYNDDRVKNHFEFRMWVCVTVNFDFMAILKGMIQYHTKMDNDINSLSIDLLQSRLLEFLAGKPFLLVLDDVWVSGYNDIEQLLKLLKKGGRGCKVLVTSRINRVSEVMGTIPSYVLDGLPEDQCWSLFEKIAFKQHEGTREIERRDLERIGREIVRKCNGLPLAVSAMGGLLRGNTDVSNWNRILKNDIWEAEEQSTNSGKPTVLPALKLSYDHLPAHLKLCFAYCCIFPKGYVFDKIELVKYWKAQSFIHSGEHNTIDDMGSVYFDDLLMRSFFQLLNIDNKKRFRMHDLIHDLAKSVSIHHCYQVRDNEVREISDRLRHVSFLCSNVETPALKVIDKCKRLRTFLSPSVHHKSFGKALDELFRSLKYIRMLDLSSSTLMELPPSVQKLKLLHYLDLSNTEIRELPNSICSLYNLQTLKLLGCLWLFQLPQDLSELVNLQHLELDDIFWFKASTLPPRMGSLTSLQNLHAFHVSQTSGYRIDELKHMNCINGKLLISKLENAVNAADAQLKDKEKLRKLVLEWSSSNGGQQDEAADETVLEELQPHLDVKELQLIRYKGTRFPSWIRDGLLQNLVSLSFNRCSKCKVLSLGQLGHLVKLDIKGMLELEEWPEAQYPSLRRMKISNCPKLRNVPRIFPAMTVLKIKKCESLQILPVTPSLNFLILVDNLVLEDWKETT